MMKAKDFIAEILIPYNEGWGYIWGMYGQLWTEAMQKKGSRQNNDMTQKYGRKWIGKRVIDCSGMHYWAAQQLGEYIYHGSNTIWKSYLKGKKGKLSEFSQTERLPGMAVFKTKGTNRHHIGTYVGGGWVIESKGTQYGVIRSPLSEWHEMGYLKNVEYELPYDWVPDIDLKPPEPSNVTLRQGSSGENVLYLQQCLNKILVDLMPLAEDGKFGALTKEAVKTVQYRAKITMDGICGPMTWAAIKEMLPKEEPEEPEEPDEPEEPELTDKQKLDILWEQHLKEVLENDRDYSGSDQLADNDSCGDYLGEDAQ